MQINVFEGARRLAVLASIVSVIGAIGLGVTVGSYAHGNYRLYSPGDKLVATPKGCDEPGSRLSTFRSTTPKRRSSSISLCFVSMEFPQRDGSVLNLVPYSRQADGTLWGATSYSPEVDRYVEQYENSFQIPADEGIKLDRAYEERRNAEWRNIGAALAIFLAVFWLGVAAVGWIVRGFAGIPRGKDARPKSED